MAVVPLLLEHPLDLADFLLHLARELLVLAIRRQVGVVCDPAGLLFGFAFHFVKSAFDLILRARFHHYLLLPPTKARWVPNGLQSTVLDVQLNQWKEQVYNL
jgi:hypothetical protein